jgi:hypothetical protein
MGQDGLPQQDLAEPRPRTFRVTVALPSTAAHTGDSMKIPGISDARTRRARAKARIERIRPSSYTMGAVMALQGESFPVRPRPRWLSEISCFLALLALAHPAGALTTGAVDLKSCVRAAGVAFAGTVSSIRAEKLDGAIVTRITFSSVVYAKGPYESHSLVLTSCGGEIDGYATTCEDEPGLQLHQRYIVLAKSDLGSRKNIYSPFVYLGEGLFALNPEKTGGPPVVHGIVGYRDGHVLVARRGGGLTPEFPLYARPGVIAVEFVPDPGTRFDEKQFLDLIRKVDKEP